MDESIRTTRDKWVEETILKTKYLLSQMKDRWRRFSSENINIMHFSSCLKALQERIDIIKSLKAISFNDSVIKIRIQGTDHNLVIDLIKLFDWVSVEKISPENSKEVEEDAVDLSKPAQLKKIKS